jgi:hypothetical protein
VTAERRLAKLEGALSPKAATLLWLAEAQEFGSLPAYVAWLIDQPISAAPLERVPAQARAAAIEAMRGQPREAVREAAYQAVRDAIFGVELVLRLNLAVSALVAQPADPNGRIRPQMPAGRWPDHVGRRNRFGGSPPNLFSRQALSRRREVGTWRSSGCPSVVGLRTRRA